MGLPGANAEGEEIESGSDADSDSDIEMEIEPIPSGYVHLQLPDFQGSPGPVNVPNDIMESDFFSSFFNHEVVKLLVTGTN